MMKLFRRVMSVSSVFAIAVLATACENPVSTDGHDDHPEVIGAVLLDADGNLLAGTGGDDGGWDLQGATAIEIEPGQEGRFQVLFVDEDGTSFHAEDDDGFSLGWDVEDEAILEIDADGEFIVVTPIDSGTTDVVFHHWHGSFPDSGHEHYSTPPLTFRTTPPLVD